MRTTVIVFGAALAAIATSAQSGDWNQWRGPNRDGVAAESAPLIDALPEDGLKPVWRTTAIEGGDNGGWSSPVVSQGRAYLFGHSQSRRKGVNLPPEKYPSLDEARRKEMSEKERTDYESKRDEEQKQRRDRQYRHVETVACHDANTGELRWKNERESKATGYSQSGTPAVVAGRLYVAGADRTLVCLDAETGEKRWLASLPVEPSEDAISSSVAIADGVAVVLAGDLVGVDCSTGKVLWKGERMQGMESSPVVWRHGDRELVVANVNGGDTVCVEPKEGRELWRVRSHANRSTPVIAGNRMITLGDSRKSGLRCFDLSEDGAKERWIYQGISDPGASPVVLDGHVFVQGENRLACVDLEMGEPTLRATLENAQARYTSLIAADGKLFYVFDGVLCLKADPKEHVALFDGRINDEGRLATAAWFRRALQIEALETSQGQEAAQRLWQKRVGQHGPLDCASPAFANGRLYVRLKNGLACYDLRADPRPKAVTDAR